jgi:hypothetical protein
MGKKKKGSSQTNKQTQKRPGKTEIEEATAPQDKTRQALLQATHREKDTDELHVSRADCCVATSPPATRKMLTFFP